MIEIDYNLNIGNPFHLVIYYQVIINVSWNKNQI